MLSRFLLLILFMRRLRIEHVSNTRGIRDCLYKIFSIRGSDVSVKIEIYFMSIPLTSPSFSNHFFYSIMIYSLF
jgi:hypothetical protein